MSPEELERAIRYSRTRELLLVVAMLYGFAVQAALLASGASAALRDLARRFADRDWVVDALYAALFGLVGRALTLPLDYYRDYVVEHRYELSNLSRGGWLLEEAKKTALSLAFEAPLTAVVYATIRRFPRRWWLVLSSLALPFTVLLAQLYPVLIAPIFNRFVPVEDAALAGRVRALAERAGVRVADVMQMDMSRQTRKANAFFAGLGPTKRIALGDTLVREFTPGEVEVIVAHELGHQVHRDIWKGVALGTVMTLGGAYLLSRLAPRLTHRFADRTGVDSIEDVASTPLMGLLLGVVSTVTMPLANAFSRQLVERPADRYALSLTGSPDAFVSGMERLARLNLADPDPPGLVKLLLHSHPTVKERIRMAREHVPG
jgi:STE24 endopeptidase